MQAQIFNIRGWIQFTDPSWLKNTFSDLLASANFEILDFREHHFEPFGYSCFWLLGESHFAIHTFPEESKTYIELSSCNEEKHQFFIANLPANFEEEK